MKRLKPVAPPEILPVRRLPDLQLPSYRFVPGLQVHPNLSESHLMPEVPIEQCWDYGWDLYNSHYWWEAHEVWERLWKALPLDSHEEWSKDHPQRRYIQGHILLSASKLLEHMGRKYQPMRDKAGRYINESSNKAGKWS